MSEAVRFQHYEVGCREDGSLQELGRGAMGVTYRAVDTNLHCVVALKVISAAYLESDVARQRFLREARAAAALRHPNVAEVFHFGEADGTCFYAMEFVAGETVESMLRREGTIPVTTALDITLQVARALGAAEKQGLVHRDLKPANLMVVAESDSESNVKVIDFGLAKNASGGGGSEDGATLTMGGFLGTPHFASPEQLEEREIDIRSDIYSLGVTLFFMLAGRAPFTGSLAQVMSQHLHREPPWEILAAVPAPAVDLLRRMMAKDPAARPATAADLRREVETCLSATQNLPHAQTVVPMMDESDFETVVPAEQTMVAPTLVPTTPIPSPPPKPNRTIPIAIGSVALVIAAGGVAFFALQKPEPVAPPPVIVEATPAPAPAAAPTATPDPLAPSIEKADRLVETRPASAFADLMDLYSAHKDREDLRQRINSTLDLLNQQASKLSAADAASLRRPLELAAAQGFPVAQLMLAEQIRETDKTAAGVWFEKAAESGDGRAQFALARYLLAPNSSPEDRTRAVALLEAGVEKKDRRAITELGRLYKNGLPGVLEPNGPEAFRLLSDGQKAGSLTAQGELGTLYLFGIGVDKDERMAVELFRDGAEKENPLCAYYYAASLEQGDPAAKAFYIRAAQGGIDLAIKWCRANNVSFEALPPLTSQ